jgi:hypothetical protein
VGDIEKIVEIAKIVSGEDIGFIIRRTESIDSMKEFEALHKRFNVEFRTTQVSCKSSGKLKPERFLAFLKEYSDEFSLEPTIIEIGAVVINPVLL